jgi:hypothetical protein
MWVASHHQPRGDEVWPSVLPYKRLCGSETQTGGKVRTGKPNAASAQSGSVVIPFDNWWVRHNLHNPSGVGADILLHPSKILKGMVKTLVKCQAATCLQGERILHSVEDVMQAWKCKGHWMEFPKNPVPFSYAAPTLSGRNLVKDLPKGLNRIRGQSNGKAFRIQNPA